MLDADLFVFVGCHFVAGGAVLRGLWWEMAGEF